MALQINIDNGGTLTDICIMTDGVVKKTKVLTTPYDLSKCFFDGLQKASEVIYGAAKAAVNNLTMGLARTYAPHVRVNCIVPGPFLTDISKAWDMERFNKAAKTGYMLQRGGEPREIVGAALYLASDASSYTTGTLLPVDGGPQ